MGVNVYLKDGIKDAEGFGVREESGGKPARTWRTPHFNSIELSIDKGRYTLHLYELTDEVPESLAEYVADVSFKDALPSKPHRTAGVYKHEDAEAELSVNIYRRDELELLIVGKSLKGIRALYRLIRAGKIAPTESWEGEQTKRVTVNLTHIAIFEVCTAFVKARFPDHEIVEIEVGGYVEEEGYFPTITICPEHSFYDEKTHFQESPNVWIGEGPYIKWRDEMVDLRRTAESVYELETARTSPD